MEKNQEKEKTPSGRIFLPPPGPARPAQLPPAPRSLPLSLTARTRSTKPSSSRRCVWTSSRRLRVRSLMLDPHRRRPRKIKHSIRRPFSPKRRAPTRTLQASKLDELGLRRDCAASLGIGLPSHPGPYKYYPGRRHFPIYNPKLSPKP